MNNTNSVGADLVAQWRNNGDLSNPAGPLFVGGEFAEADILSETIHLTVNKCGTACSGSHTRQCC